MEKRPRQEKVARTKSVEQSTYKGSLFYRIKKIEIFISYMMNLEIVNVGMSLTVMNIMNIDSAGIHDTVLADLDRSWWD
jgi:hypothetical protein